MKSKNPFMMDGLLYWFGKSTHFSSYSWSSLTTTEFSVEQFVLIHLKCHTVKLTLCALGSVSAQPIKNTVIS